VLTLEAEMNVLAVLPAYQRLGIGQAMLANVLPLADEEGRRVFVEGTPEGASLYHKFGWVECDEPLRFDLAEFGAGEGVLEPTLFLMREPGAGGPGM
jgi:GNAT superfamily N-acetyltransferase